MSNFDFLCGENLSDQEMVVVHGGVSISMSAGVHCGSGCDGGSGNHCGKDCRPSQTTISSGTAVGN